MTGPGHNSRNVPPKRADGGAIAVDRLRGFVERVERLREEITALNGDVKEVYAEAKGEGYDVKTLKLVIARRAKDDAALAEQDELLAVYLRALGMDDALAGAGARDEAA